LYTQTFHTPEASPYAYVTITLWIWLSVASAYPKMFQYFYLQCLSYCKFRNRLIKTSEFHYGIIFWEAYFVKLKFIVIGFWFDITKMHVKTLHQQRDYDYVLLFTCVSHFLRSKVLEEIYNINTVVIVVRSPELKPSVSFSDRPLDRLSVCTLLHFRLLLQNHWANFNKTFSQIILGWRGFKYEQMKGIASFQREIIAKE
jgi:hypothetical protein